MVKYCVKKPFTVLVGVVMVLVLGFISFTHLTTDLLPAIELPYVVVVTSYPGASPEKVETSVTRPLEAALGTTGGVKNISSVSSENASAVILEFEQGTNMDTAMLNISTSVDLVKGSFDEMVGTPMLLQISPDMMPVMIAGVDREDMDIRQLSAYVQETVVPAIERLDGVASVQASGLVESTLEVKLDDEKIAALNDKVLAAVDEQLADAKQKLDEGQARLSSGKQQLESGKTALADKQQQAGTQLSAGGVQLDSAIAQLNALLSQESTLQASQAALQAEKEAYEQALGQIPGLEELWQQAVDQIEQALGERPDWLPGSLEELAGMTAEEFAALRDQMRQWLDESTAAALDGLDWEQIQQMLEMYLKASVRLMAIEQELSNISTQMMAVQAAKPVLEENLKKAQEGYAALEQGKMEAAIGMANGQAALTASEAQLAEAEAQLEEAAEQFEQARQEAYEKANLSGLLTRDTISAMLLAQNFSMPAGTITEDGEQYVVKVGDSFSSVEEVENALLFSMEDSVGDIRLKDVATVQMTDNANESYAKINGNDAVLLTVQKSSTASTSAVSDRISSAIESLETTESGLRITPLMDQGDYIYLIIDSVLQNLIVGGILAVLVLLFFLKDLKPTAVIAFSIPISVLFALALMYFSNITLNIISLSGLALGVGMLVDNSIVVIENIYRLRSQGMSAARAAVKGTTQVGGAIAASTFTTICVFLPIVFTEGLSRQLFTDMGLTIAYSLLASLVVAMTLVPAMGSTLLRNTRPREHRWFDAFVNGYTRVLQWALGHRAVTLGAAGLLLVGACFWATRMGTAFIPEMSSPQMTVTVEMPKEADREEQFALADTVMERIQAIDGVETVGAMAGDSGASVMGMSTGGSDGSASFYVLLSDEGAKKNQQIAAQIEQDTADLPCTVSANASAMDLSALGGSGVQVILRGPDLDVLADLSNQVAERMAQVEGLTDISTGQQDANPETRITIDKDAAMRKGLTVAQVYQQVSAALTTSSTATTLTVDNESYSVVLEDAQDAPARADLTQLELTAATPTGEEQTVKLGDIASIEEAPGLVSISRENQQRTRTVSASIADGYNIGLCSRQLENNLQSLSLPDGYTLEYGGENETINSTMQDLALMILLAVVFIYLIMVAQFQSLLSPFIVMFTIPLAFTGGLLALGITGQELSIIAMLGFLILVGVVVNNGIVFVDYTNQLRLEGMEKQAALVETGRSRIRPILMTALTTILAMSTMALATGTGAEMTQPMAIVTIGGLTYATLLTLVVVPVLYDLLFRRELHPVEVEED